MKIFLRIILIFSSLLTFACQQKSGKELGVIPAKETKSSMEAIRTKVAKPGAPVSLASANLVSIVANQTAIVSILLKTQGVVGALHVEVSPSEGLQIVSNSNTQNLQINAEGYYPISVSVLAKNDGRYYLNLSAIIDDGENISSRGLAVIIQAGALSDAEVPHTKMLKSTTDENVISMPAQENITNH